MAGSRKQIAFDLDTNAIKMYDPAGCAIGVFCRICENSVYFSADHDKGSRSV